MNTCSYSIQASAEPPAVSVPKGSVVAPRRYFTSKGMELSPENLAMMKQVENSSSSYFISNRRVA